MIRIFDIRMMREFKSMGTNKEVMSLAWHPQHETLFSSIDSAGILSFWLITFILIIFIFE